MEKVDYFKTQKDLYNPTPKEPVMVEVPEFCFLMIDGKGDPNTTKEYQAAVQALFSLSYTIKFMIKKGTEQIDYHVLPLEGLWWAEDMEAFVTGDKSKWFWTVMIRQPDFVTEEHFKNAMENVKKKDPGLDLSKVRFEKFNEGKSAQIMHIGPFSAEGPTIQKMHDFISAAGFKRRGKHHEIYLSDIRKAAPEKWKTILRQPVE
jgi:hypothetical protein